MNRDVIWCVLVLIVLCLIGAVGNTTWLASYSEYIPFLNTKTFEETQPFYDGFLVFWTFVITLQVIIPMSLYVTLEMTKLLLIYLMQQGKYMFFVLQISSIKPKIICNEIISRSKNIRIHLHSFDSH